jgi:hypothetical protein
VAEEPEALAAEDERADDRVHQISREGEAPERADRARDPCVRVSVRERHDGEAEGDRQRHGAELVDALRDHPRARFESVSPRQDHPGRREGHAGREECQWHTEGAKTVGAPVTCANERAPFEHAGAQCGHSEQHATGCAPPCLEEKPRGLPVECERGTNRQLNEVPAAVRRELRRDAACIEVLDDAVDEPRRQRLVEQTRNNHHEWGHDHERKPDRHEPFDAPRARAEHCKADDGVREQNVAVPNQIRVQEAEHHEPGEATPRRSIAGEDERRAEKHREQVQELEIEEESPNRPRGPLGPVERAVDRGVQIGGVGQRERLDVHDENAEQACASEHVDCGQPGGHAS